MNNNNNNNNRQQMFFDDKKQNQNRNFSNNNSMSQASGDKLGKNADKLLSRDNLNPGKIFKVVIFKFLIIN